MDRIARIGVDLAKNVMQLHGVDAAERVVVRKAVSRDKFLEWFANRERCVIAMEACSSAHFWARRLREMGHDVRLIPPQFAAPYRKGGARVKNDNLSFRLLAAVTVTRAHWNKRVRRYSLPCLVTRPSRSFPPLLFCFGTSPSHAANCRPFRNWRASPTVAVAADAVSSPTPNISTTRLAL